MVSMYHGVETGKSAISYFKKSMELSGINTSNAKVEGYSRQVAANAAKSALSTGRGYSMLGTGVQITEIERMRDQFLDARLRRANVELAYYETMESGMARVEMMVRGSNDASFDVMLDNFWASVQDVHITPNEGAVRGTFLEETDTLVEFVRTLRDNYVGYRDELNKDIRSMVEEANSLIDQIAVLNRGIATLQNAGAEPNEILDKRDLLMDQLAVLTGAVSSSSDRDMMDGDYKVTIDGRTVVQGTQTRHLVLVENPTNNGYYEVQIEYNQYDITSNPDAVGVIIEQRADDLRENNGTCTMDALHKIEVVREADEKYWQVGHGLADKAGGERITGLGPNDKLGIDGSFALSVGSAGVRIYSEIFDDDPPGVGVILGDHTLTPESPKSYTFRLSAGEAETTITIEWDEAANEWKVSDNSDPINEYRAAQITTENLADNLGKWFTGSQIAIRSEDGALIFESLDRHLISITDISGDLMMRCGAANKSPVVLIEVTSEDSLQTIANKINNAYMFDKIYQIEGDDDDQNAQNLLAYKTVPADTAPSKPEEWMHASVEKDANGDHYLLLTSNVAGEAHRINVMSGSVCGDVDDMTVARLLGLVEKGYETEYTGTTYANMKDITSYVQVDETNGDITDRYTRNGDVFVDDAYVILDGKKEYLSDQNMFNDARQIALVGNAPADVRSEFSPGIRVQVNGIGSSDIIVRHTLVEGQIWSAVKLRDDVLLSHMDAFDDMMYELATQFNAIHYAGYGDGDCKEITGMKFFDSIAGRYGAFSELKIDSKIISDEGFDYSRLAAMSGDGRGHNIGTGDGSNALAIAQLKQAKLFMSGTSDFNDYYLDFVTKYASFGAKNKTMMESQKNVVEKIKNERSSVMDVNLDEEMMNIVEMNQQFNYTSRYLSTLMQVMDQIISGLGRVGL